MFQLARTFHKNARRPLSTFYTCIAVFEFADSVWVFTRHLPGLGFFLVGLGILFGTFAGIMRAVSYED